jgi:hypothetical protein
MSGKKPLQRFEQDWQEWLSAPVTPDAQELRCTLPGRLPAQRPRSRKRLLYSVVAAAATLVVAMGALLLLRQPAPESRQQPAPPVPQSLVHTVNSNVVLLVSSSGEPIYVVLADSPQEGDR